MALTHARWLPPLLALAVLAACQTPHGDGGVGVAPTKKPASPRPAATGAVPSATPSAAPTAGAPATAAPSGAPSAQALAAPPLLRKPAGGGTTLAGVVRLDASYLVAAGAGAALTGADGLLVAAGGGTLVANNGSSLLSDAGGTVIANNGGNVIAHGGGVLVGAGAANLLGGALVAAKAGGYRLTQAAPAVGTIAPAAGVEIGVWSPERGGFLPIGEDAAGQPVYTVYTNLAGKYELYLPADAAGTGLVVAIVDRASADPRLSLGVLTPVDAKTEVTIDEDTVLVTAYMRAFMASRLLAAIQRPDTAALVRDLGGEALVRSPELSALLTAFLKAFGEEGRRLGLDRDEAKARVAVLRATDYGFKRLDLAAVPRVFTPDWYDVVDPAPIFETLLDLMRALRLGATAKLAADPAFPGKTSFLPKIDARRAAAGLAPFVVRKPGDFGQLMVDEYLTVLDEGRLLALVGPQDEAFADIPVYKALRTLVRELGALSVPEAIATGTRPDGTRIAGAGLGNDNVDRMTVAMQNVLFAVLNQLVLMAPEEQAAMRARLAEPPAAAAP